VASEYSGGGASISGRSWSRPFTAVAPWATTGVGGVSAKCGTDAGCAGETIAGSGVAAVALYENGFQWRSRAAIRSVTDRETFGRPASRRVPREGALRSK
jgi:hypothetical protein